MRAALHALNMLHGSMKIDWSTKPLILDFVYKTGNQGQLIQNWLNEILLFIVWHFNAQRCLSLKFCLKASRFGKIKTFQWQKKLLLGFLLNNYICCHQVKTFMRYSDPAGWQGFSKIIVMSCIHQVFISLQNFHILCLNWKQAPFFKRSIYLWI